MTVQAYLIQSSLSCFSPMLPKAQHRWDRKQRQLNSHTSVLQQVNWGASNEEADSGPEDIKLSGSRARKVLVVKQFHLICRPVERLSLHGAPTLSYGAISMWGMVKTWEQASHISSMIYIGRKWCVRCPYRLQTGWGRKEGCDEETPKGGKRWFVWETILEAQGWKRFKSYLT